MKIHLVIFKMFHVYRLIFNRHSEGMRVWTYNVLE
jgi:hypothetical protein